MSENILQRIVAEMRPVLEASKSRVSLAEMKRRAELARPVRDFAGAFRDRTKINVIAELKKASPSKGIIREDFRYREFAESLARAGAAAFSVLTERNYFLGSLAYLREVAETTPLPVLRKDFLFDAYQIYEARANGADAVLLIAAMLDDAALHEFAERAADLGMSVLGEAHTQEELERILAVPEITLAGVNARDLRSFKTDLARTQSLIGSIPADRIPIAESAIRTRADIDVLRKAGAAGFLIGETLMRADDPGGKLGELIR